MAKDVKTEAVAHLKDAYPDIPGLMYHKDVIDKKTEQSLWSFLYGTMMKPRKWSNGPGGAMARRVQQYGYEYNYNSKSILPADPIPLELQTLITELQEKKLLPNEVNQIIVNEYRPGQGITAHTDDVRWFGEQISSLTLHSGCKMIMADRSASVIQGIYLEPRSILTLTGPARCSFTHMIPSVKKDLVKNSTGETITIPRGTRVSITFRQVLPGAISKK